MLIDTNAYLGHWPFRRLRHNTAPELVALMDEKGIDRAWVSSASAVFYRNTQAGNEELSEQIEPYRDRLIFYAVINPTYADWEHDLAVCAEQFGAKGVRLYPNYHNYRLGDAHCRALVEAATELGLVISLPVRQEDPRQRHWLIDVPDLELEALAALVEAHPQARFVLLEGAGYTGSRLGRAEGGLPANYWIEISRLSAVLAAEIRVLMDNLGPERLVFGTGMPFKYPDPALANLQVLQATEAEKDLICSQTALHLLQP